MFHLYLTLGLISFGSCESTQILLVNKPQRWECRQVVISILPVGIGRWRHQVSLLLFAEVGCTSNIWLTVFILHFNTETKNRFWDLYTLSWDSGYCPTFLKAVDAFQFLKQVALVSLKQCPLTVGTRSNSTSIFYLLFPENKFASDFEFVVKLVPFTSLNLCCAR